MPLLIRRRNRKASNASQHPPARAIAAHLVRRGRAARPRGREGQWKKEAGYHRRSLAETAVLRFKTPFSDKLKAREWRGQEAELRARCAALNRMTS